MNFYLEKYGFQKATITELPQENLGMCVVIPCFNEPDVIPSLTALHNCSSPTCGVEVFLVINAGEKHAEEIKAINRDTFQIAKDWGDQMINDQFKLHVLIEENLPKKHAGVGLARKIGMDEAVNRFDLLDKDGIIVCFDADSECDPNYLVEIEKHFKKHPKTPGCSIYYEHPLEGTVFDQAVYSGIINYELHLRYYNQGLVFANLPYAYHTVGSSMAVRSSAYQKQGGMNKRKAGEDFYFIHKIIELGNFTELKTTRVIPSPRISDRVPFGTGKAIGDWIESKADYYHTYAFESFVLLKKFVTCVPQLSTYQLEEIDSSLSNLEKERLLQFLDTQKWESALAEIRKNSKTQEAFEKRFFRWFDAFKVLKLMHFLRDNGVGNQPILGEVNKLLIKISDSQSVEKELDQLLFIRAIEKK